MTRSRRVIIQFYSFNARVESKQNTIKYETCRRSTDFNNVLQQDLNTFFRWFTGYLHNLFLSLYLINMTEFVGTRSVRIHATTARF